MHFAVHFKPGRVLLQDAQGVAHFDGAGLVAAAKVGVAQERGFGRNAKAQHFFSRHHGDAGEFARGGVVVDVGIDHKHLAPGQHQAVHAGVNRHVLAAAGRCRVAFANDLVDVVQVQRGGAPGAADHAVHVALVQQHGANQGEAPAHFNLGHRHGHALALGHLVVGLPEVAVAVVVFYVDHGVMLAFAQAQAKFGDALGNHGRAANQRGHGQAFVHHDLGGAQHALVFAFGKGDAFFERILGHGKNRPHGGARGVDKALQLLAVGVHVSNRAQGHAALKRGLRHGRGDFHHQARIERLGDQVFRAKSELLAGIGGGDHVALLGLGQFGNGVHRCNFHLDGDGRGARVERAPEDVWKAQDVVDLIVVVAAAGGHDGVVTHGLDFFGQDFGRGVGQRKDQGLGRHAFHHVWLEHAAGRQAQKHVGPGDHVAQGACVGLLGKKFLVRVHQLGAALVDHTGQVGHKDVFTRNAEFDQQPQAGQRSRACT